jgi:hypothetical protein
MGRHCLSAFFIVCTLLSFARAEKLTIATNGASDCVVATAKDPQPSERFAADEIAKYLKQITGAEIKRVETDEPPANCIMIMQENLPADGFTITKPESQGIVITGSNGRSTIHAAYTFLDMLGCRFLAPRLSHYNGSAEVIPSQKNLSFDPAHEIELKAQLAFRKLYVEEGHSHTPENLAQIVEWMPKGGYNTLVVPTNYQGAGRVMWDNFRAKVAPECQKRGITIEVGGHGYQNFLNAEMEDGKLVQQHPEYFGADAKGERQKNKGRVFCTSNHQAVEYLIKNFLAYVKDRPEIQIFDFWPPDGAKWCECDACKALGEPPDRQAILLKQVQEKVKPVRPDLRLEIIAYSSYVKPPQREKVDPNVLVDFCPIGQQFDVQINDPSSQKNKQYADALAEWRKAFAGDISIYSYYRKYAWDSLPVIIPHYMQKDLQWYATLPLQGVSVYSEPGDWFTYELNHYVLGQLGWDVNANVDALIGKFCEARYGDEAPVAQKTLTALGEITRTYCSVPNVPMKDAAAIETAKGKAQELVDSVSAAQGRASSPQLRRNLQKLELMCTYALKDLEVQHMRASNAPTDAIKQKATELHQWVSQHADDGVFLVKDHRLNLPRMLKRLGVGEEKKPAAE